MYLALCADTRMLVGVLLTLLALGAVGMAAIIFALVAIARWADRRQTRLAVNER